MCLSSYGVERNPHSRQIEDGQFRASETHSQEIHRTPRHCTQTVNLFKFVLEVSVKLENEELDLVLKVGGLVQTSRAPAMHVHDAIRTGILLKSILLAP